MKVLDFGNTRSWDRWNLQFLIAGAGSSFAPGFGYPNTPLEALSFFIIVSNSFPQDGLTDWQLQFTEKIVIPKENEI